MKRLALLLPLLALAAAARAADPATTARAEGWGVDERTIVFGNGLTVTEVPEALRGAARAEVPRELLGRPVAALAPGLFAGCTNLEAVALPPSLRAVPDGAFRGCANLREADLGAVARIGEGAFEGCARLEGLRFPASLAEIGPRAFAGCAALREAWLEEGLERIGEEALAGCTALRGVALPASLAEIGPRAFAGCTALERLAMPEAPAKGAGGALAVGEGALRGCTALRSVSLGSGGRLDLGDEALADCTALRDVRLSGTAGRLGAGLFRGCRSLRAAAIPPGAAELPPRCFRDCSALESLALPASVAAVGDEALRGCASLRRLELPGPGVRFGRGAVAGCDALVVSWRSADPATAAGVPAERLGAAASVADGGAEARARPRAGAAEGAAAVVPAAAAPAPPPAGGPEAEAEWTELAGAVRWRWRPAPEGDGAEIVGASLLEKEGSAPRDGRTEASPSPRLQCPDSEEAPGMRGALDVAVPERLGGLPVAALGPGSLAGLPAMRLVVPASVRRVGAGAVRAAALERLVFLGGPPAFAPGWAAPEKGAERDGVDPFDWLERPAAPEGTAAEWEALLAPAPPPDDHGDAAGAEPDAFAGEETVRGVRWTYSVRDGFAWAGAGPGRPAVAAEDAAGSLEVPARLGGLPVRGLARGALRGCTALRELRFGGAGGRFEIGPQALRDCTALERLVPAPGCTVAAIGAEALRGCTALERLDARGCASFGPAALAGCTALRELRLGPGPEGAPAALPPLFAAGCRSLKTADLPVSRIGRGAFRGCTALREARLSPALDVLGAEAFAGCGALRRAEVPADCRRVGPGVFDRTPLAPGGARAAGASAGSAWADPPVAFRGEDEPDVAALSVSPEVLLLPSDEPSSATVRLSLAGVGFPRGGRAPVNLALALDRSAAVRGEPFERMREAALAALERLDGRDAVTLVAFGRRAEVLAEALPATDANRAALAARLRALETDAAPGAALFGGVAAAAAGLRGSPVRDSVSARLLVLLSGGTADAGPSDPDDFRRLGASLAREGFSVFAAGAAPGRPADATAALAEGAGGAFRDTGPEGAADAVAARVDEALRVVATGARLVVEFRGGARPVAVSGAGGEPLAEATVARDAVSVDLPPVVFGRSSAVDVRVEFPARAPGGRVPFARATAGWLAAGGAAGAASAPCLATFSEPAP